MAATSANASRMGMDHASGRVSVLNVAGDSNAAAQSGRPGAGPRR